MKYKILISSFAYPPQHNGVSHVVEAQATGLARLGHDVTVVTGLGLSDRPVDLSGAVKVRRFATQGNGQWLLGGYTGDITGYQEYIAAFKGDLLICHCWQTWSTDLAARVFEHVNCPKILVSHGVSAAVHDKTLKSLLLRLAWQPYLAGLPALIRKFDHVVFLSEKMNSGSFMDHQLMHRLDDARHRVIPNGVDPGAFAVTSLQKAEFRARHQLIGKPLILYVANYGDGKNQKMAIEVFRQAAVKDAVLVLIGSEFNEYTRQLEPAVQQAGGEGRRVILLEKQTPGAIQAAYGAADLFLCTSKLEVQPLVILEAMAAGTPFVSTDVGCVSELPGGLVARDQVEMVRVVSRLMQDQPLRQRLGQEGRLAVTERHSWASVVQQYEDLIREICSFWKMKQVGHER